VAALSDVVAASSLLLLITLPPICDG